MFYRDFYKKCDSDVFSNHKDILEKYLNENLNRPLTKRNKLFSVTTIKNHPWIPLEKACKDFKIHKSILRRAIRKNQIRHEVEVKEKRSFISVFRPDLENRLYRLHDVIAAKEAAKLLGVTKSQFSIMRNENLFETAIKPDSDCFTWQFSRDEIIHFRDKYTKGLVQKDGKYWSLAQILQFYGARVDNALITIIRAIDKKELKAESKLQKTVGLRAIQLSKDEFKVWYEDYKVNGKSFSIPCAAKKLGLNQEFTYQLVKESILPTVTSRTGKTQTVTNTCMREFHDNYIVLSKLTKESNKSSRKVIRDLAEREIFPVDELWKNKLRQKLYLKKDFEKITPL